MRDAWSLSNEAVGFCFVTKRRRKRTFLWVFRCIWCVFLLLLCSLGRLGARTQDIKLKTNATYDRMTPID